MITEARECEYLIGGSKQKFIVFLERLGNYEHWGCVQGDKIYSSNHKTPEDARIDGIEAIALKNSTAAKKNR